MRKRWASPAPDPGGLEGQQQVEGEAAGPAAAMEVVVDGPAQHTAEQRAPPNIDGNIVHNEHNAPRMQARGPGKHYR